MPQRTLCAALLGCVSLLHAVNGDYLDELKEKVPYYRTMTGRVVPIEGDALDLPFKDNFADFVFSRGSIPFWPDQVQGLKECYRILKPGGVAYVGGGFGRLLDPAIRAELVKDHLNWKEKPDGWQDIDDLDKKAEQAGLPRFRFLTEPDVGWWLEIRK